MSDKKPTTKAARRQKTSETREQANARVGRQMFEGVESTADFKARLSAISPKARNQSPCVRPKGQSGFYPAPPMNENPTQPNEDAVDALRERAGRDPDAPQYIAIPASPHPPETGGSGQRTSDQDDSRGILESRNVAKQAAKSSLALNRNQVAAIRIVLTKSLVIVEHADTGEVLLSRRVRNYRDTWRELWAILEEDARP